MQPPSPSQKRHSFRPLLFVPPTPASPRVEALPKALPPPVPPARRPQAANTNGVRPTSDSHVRLRATAPVPAAPPAAAIDHLDAQDLLDELCEDQLVMSMNLACLEKAVESAPRDASARAALRTLSARIADLTSLRDALAAVQVAAIDPRLHRMFVEDAPLADYLRGVYAWVHAAMRALDQLASSLRSLSPDWALLRWRLSEAKNFHFDELFEPIRKDLVALGIVASAGSLRRNPPDVAALQYAVEHLFATATALEDHLDERFG